MIKKIIMGLIVAFFISSFFICNSSYAKSKIGKGIGIGKIKEKAVPKEEKMKIKEKSKEKRIGYRDNDSDESKGDIKDEEGRSKAFEKATDKGKDKKRADHGGISGEKMKNQENN